MSMGMPDYDETFSANKAIDELEAIVSHCFSFNSDDYEDALGIELSDEQLDKIVTMVDNAKEMLLKMLIKEK